MKNIVQFFKSNISSEALTSRLNCNEVKSCSTTLDDLGFPLLTVITLCAGADDVDSNDTVFVLDHGQKRFYQASKSEWEDFIYEYQEKKAF